MQSVDLIGTRLRQLSDLLDAGIHDLYTELGIPGFRPRFAPVLMALADRPADATRTIKELAADVGVTHSAMSQTVARLIDDGLAVVGSAPDGRAKAVSLSELGRRTAGIVRMEWEATTRAARALEAEMAHPLSVALDEAIALLAKTPFAERLRV